MSKPTAIYALCEVKPARVRHPNRQKRQRFPVPAWRFREARFACGLSLDACADLLRVSDRTIRNWESGACRIPYAAYKLMRVLKGGKLLGPEWRDFHVWRGVLHTPEGHRFEAGELSWWSLLVRRARAFSELLAVQSASSGRPQPHAASSGAGKEAPACRPAGQQAETDPDATPASAASLGLVYSPTTQTLDTPESGSTAENKAKRAFALVAPKGPGRGPSPRLDSGPYPFDLTDDGKHAEMLVDCLLEQAGGAA